MTFELTMCLDSAEALPSKQLHFCQAAGHQTHVMLKHQPSMSGWEWQSGSSEAGGGNMATSKAGSPAQPQPITKQPSLVSPES